MSVELESEPHGVLYVLSIKCQVTHPPPVPIGCQVNYQTFSKGIDGLAPGNCLQEFKSGARYRDPIQLLSCRHCRERIEHGLDVAASARAFVLSPAGKEVVVDPPDSGAGTLGRNRPVQCQPGPGSVYVPILVG